jgi:hypothetical protein
MPRHRKLEFAGAPPFVPQKGGRFCSSSTNKSRAALNAKAVASASDFLLALTDVSTAAVRREAHPTPRRASSSLSNAPGPFWSAAALPPLFRSRPPRKRIKREAPPRNLTSSPVPIHAVVSIQFPPNRKLDFPGAPSFAPQQGGRFCSSSINKSRAALNAEMFSSVQPCL